MFAARSAVFLLLAPISRTRWGMNAQLLSYLPSSHEEESFNLGFTSLAYFRMWGLNPDPGIESVLFPRYPREATLAEFYNCRAYAPTFLVWSSWSREPIYAFHPIWVVTSRRLELRRIERTYSSYAFCSSAWFFKHHYTDTKHFCFVLVCFVPFQGLVSGFRPGQTVI